MGLLLEIMRGLGETVREALPTTVAEAAPFVAGLAWGIGLCWAALLTVTWLHCAGSGGC